MILPNFPPAVNRRRRRSASDIGKVLGHRDRDRPCPAGGTARLSTTQATSDFSSTVRDRRVDPPIVARPPIRASRFDLDLGPGPDADDHDPGARGQVGEHGLDPRRPDQLEGDVVGAVVGHPSGRSPRRRRGPHLVAALGMRTVATTRAPATAGQLDGRRATPPAAPEMSTRSPTASSAWVNSAS